MRKLIYLLLFIGSSAKAQISPATGLPAGTAPAPNITYQSKVVDGVREYWGYDSKNNLTFLQYTGAGINYYFLSKTDAANTYQPKGNYLTNFSETDPTVSAYIKSITSFSNIKSSTDLYYQPILTYTPVNSTGTITINGTSQQFGSNPVFSVGTVRSVGGINSNGFTWSIANSGTTPALTLTGDTVNYFSGKASANARYNATLAKFAALPGTYQPLENQRLSSGYTPTFAGANLNGLVLAGQYNLGGFDFSPYINTASTGRLLIGQNLSFGGSETDFVSLRNALGVAGTYGGFEFYDGRNDGSKKFLLRLNGNDGAMTTGGTIVPGAINHSTGFSNVLVFGGGSGNEIQQRTLLEFASDLGVVSSINTTQQTVSGSTSGTAIFSQPFRASSYKKVIVYCAAVNGTASYTFPSAFTYVPNAVLNPSSISYTLSNTQLTINGSGITGIITFEGY